MGQGMIIKEVETFTWEKLDYVDEVKEAFGLIDFANYLYMQRLRLREPIYSDAAAYGHMGRKPEIKKLQFVDGSGNVIIKEVETFTWEKLDYVDEVKEAFGL